MVSCDHAAAVKSGGLHAVCAVILRRFPRVDLGHCQRRVRAIRRAVNWPLTGMRVALGAVPLRRSVQVDAGIAAGDPWRMEPDQG